MNGDQEPDDLVELGRQSRLPDWRPPDWRPSRGTQLLAVAALVIGAGAGYAVGHGQAHGSAAPRATVTAKPSYSISMSLGTPSAAAGQFAFSGELPITQDTPSCSTQRSHELQVGIQVTNQSAEPVVLQSAHAVLPLSRGLKEVGGEWAPCGALPGTVSQANEVILPAGDSTWLSVTLNVQVRCPGAYPVQFAVKYQTQGHEVNAALPGFPDLGAVPYTGCSLSCAEQVRPSRGPMMARASASVARACRK